MDVFKIHSDVISDYAEYTQSFIKISDKRISEKVRNGIENGLLWPEPLLQLNPSFEPGQSIEQLVPVHHHDNDDATQRVDWVRERIRPTDAGREDG